MAKISSKRPTNKNINRKGAPPKVEEASNNMTSISAAPKVTAVRKDLNFKVNADFKKRFKNFATNHDMSMLELLVKSFEYYESHHQ